MAQKGINELFEVMQKLIADGINCELDVLGGMKKTINRRLIYTKQKAGFIIMAAQRM